MPPGNKRGSEKDSQERWQPTGDAISKRVGVTRTLRTVEEAFYARIGKYAADIGELIGASLRTAIQRRCRRPHLRDTWTPDGQTVADV